MLDENRWRASRYGIDGKLIDFGREAEVETRSLLNELIEFVSTEIVELGSIRELEHIERIMREGTGADRQLAVFAPDERHEGGGRSNCGGDLRGPEASWTATTRISRPRRAA